MQDYHKLQLDNNENLYEVLQDDKDIYYKLLLDLDLLIDSSNTVLRDLDYNKLVDNIISDIVSYFIKKYDLTMKYL